MKTSPTQRQLLLAIACALGAPLASAQLTDISNEPLAQPAADVKPNIVLILDDSGSMTQQYTPDYLGRKFGGSNPLCFDTLDSSSNITGSLKNCEAGDVPIHSPDVNTQYYNPEIRYLPAVNYDGTAKTNMDAANTSNWTAVPTDGVSLSTNAFQRDTRDMNGGGGVVTTENLVTGYPDRVWCTDPADTATDTTKCKTNSAYSYPDSTYGYGLNGSGNVKYKDGAAYYYRLATTEYCTDQNMTTCVAATAPVTISGVTYDTPAPVRYCRDSTLANCQAKYKETGTTYTYPKFLGNVNPGTTGITGAQATGRITVLSQLDTAGATITGIFVGGVNIISSSAFTLSSGFTPTSAATAIAGRINSFTSSPDYTATSSSGVVTVTAAATGAAPNGLPISLTFTVGTKTAATAAAAQISGTSVGDSITSFSVTVAGTTYQLINSTITCTTTLACGATSTLRNTFMRNALVAAINARTGITGFSAGTSSTDQYTLTAPQSLGSSVNGIAATRNAPGMTVDVNAFAGGITPGDMEYSTVAMANGVNTVPPLAPFRQNVGTFSRVNLIPFQDPPTNSVPSTFTKYAGRSDCAGASCTYAEEMTNFANWYAYYRSRMQMAKTAIGRAFVGVTSTYRVGFITINPAGDLTNRFLAVNDFTGGANNQRDLWYQWLYKQATHGSTPLREALSRVGRYFAGKQDGINTGMPASPIQLACQPNYAILTTDGYWNGEPGRTLTDTGTGSSGGLGNYDNTDSGYSLRTEARYDGGLSGSTGTLSDVALYYYKTDLRTDLSDFVPTSTRDPAPHQHMTTFTVGLGLAGQLTFDQNYESGSSADFERLKTPPASGGLDWPVPAADSETALDDLWHAAVNGRGKFFSASDPSALANAITESLNSIQARVGAGAAAATSNLQPVAGDNFAFTAQYETVTWIGDLKAQTIDLSNGNVATRTLWSAAALLDNRDHTTRRIYTFDGVSESASTPPAPANKLKSFCWPGAPLVTYTTCNDGAGLTSTELDYFEPLLTSASPSSEPPLVQTPPWSGDSSGRTTSATREKLVDFLRGDRSNELSGGAATTDLFRSRTSVMGDIIDAQPAYAKASPFNYRDSYYTAYKNTTNGITSTRLGTVYVGANDGMLHAFETDPDNVPYFQTAGISTISLADDAFQGTISTDPVTGEGSERWAYIPSFILPHIKRLADSPYVHQYYTDGSPVLGDVCFGVVSADCPAQTNWHTIVVAGANGGGRGYYALDVTDPANPKALWEVRGGTGATCLTSAQANAGTFGEDCNIGLTYGNPIIVKRKSDGKWVVVFTSGYNNVSPGDGKGYLYLVDAETGLILQRLTTNAGSTTAPSGLGRINAWVDEATSDNTAKAIYGGDLLGNVWRFQLDNTAAVPVNSVTKLATVAGPGGTLQPITVKPELGEVGSNKNRVIFFGTGKFIGDTDKSTVARQSIYAIKDALDAACSGTCTDPAGATAVTSMTRTGSYPNDSITGFTKQTLVASTTSPATERTTCIDPPGPCPANPDFDSSSTKGWFIDLPDGGTGTNASERVNNDPVLQVGTLVVPSNVPTNDTCLAGGFGWLNFLDYKTGKFVQGAPGNMASRKITSSLVVGINVVQLPGNVIKTIVTTADNQHSTSDTPTAASGPTGKRISWRELFQEQ